MKKLFSIFSIGLLLASVSCVKEKETVLFDPSSATPPAIQSFVVTEDGITATISPAVYNQSYNQKVPVSHSFVLKSANGKEINRQVSSKEEGNTLSVTALTLSRLLLRNGFAEGDAVALSLAVRGVMQGVVDNGTGAGSLESVATVDVADFVVTLPKGSPYQEYTQASPWSVIGALSAYGISWDNDLEMWTDGNGNHVAAHVSLDAGDEFKFRKDQDWGVNYGGDFSGQDSEFALAQDGPNIKVGVAGVYDLFFNESGTAWISAAFDPYPEFTESSSWSVIGALSKLDINWNGDVPMISDGTSHVALSVSLAADDEFKFRKDADWAVNLGGEFGGVDNDFPVTQDGPNIKVGAEGVYDLFVNPEAGTAKVVAAAGAKVSQIIKSDEPEPGPEPVTGWNIIGLNGDWDNDILATEDGNVWTAFITAEGDTDFKWRKDGGWDENYGGVMAALGEPFEAVPGGDNIKVGAGFYKVVLDTEALTITVSLADEYSLIGEINGDAWTKDVLLAGEGGVWTSPVVYIGGGFKIRHNFSWADTDTYGAEDGFTVTPGVPFTAVQPGSNISVEAGNYVVRFTPATGEVLVSSVDYEIPEIDFSAFEYLPVMEGAATWGIIGPAVLDWNTDVDLQKIQDEPEVWAAMNVPFQKGSFKFRGNDEWGDYDLGGGSFALNIPIAMTKGGGDMTAELGVYTVYLFPTYGVAYLTEGSGDVPPPPAKPEAWSLIGTLNGTAWDTDFDLTNTSGDIWKITNVAVTEADEFKIRADHDWSVNVGGPEANDKSIISPDNPYDVYKPVVGVAFETGGLNIHIGVAGNYNISFDYAANTILIEEYREFPEHLYMIGSEFGGWDWGSDGVVEMTPVLHNPEWGAEAEGQFYTVRYFTAGEGFKFCSQRAWSGDFWGLAENDGFVESGGNCTVSQSGFYLVHIDFKAGKVHVEPARVYGIGDAFGGWDEAKEENLFQADGKQLKATAPKAGALRMYVASAIATSGWWTREFNVIDGALVYRLMDELAAPQVKAEQLVTLDFNAGTGSISGEGSGPSYKSEISVPGAYSGSEWNLETAPKLYGNADGVFKGALCMFNDGAVEFKFGHDGSWIGGTGSNLSYTLGAGDNLTIADGVYFWTVNLADNTATALSVSKVGLIGSFNGWSEDLEMTFSAEDKTYSATLTLEADAELKVRFNGNWDYCLGGEPGKLSAVGGNLKVAEAGSYTAKLDLNKGTLTLTK